MALQQISLSSSSSSSMMLLSSATTTTTTSASVPEYLRCAFVGGDRLSLIKNVERRSSRRNGVRGVGVVVRSSLDMAGPVVGQVTEVNKDTFWPLVNASGDKVVVLDMYTQWCGPCKVIAPKYKELSEKYLDVVFMKLDCNQDNKVLAKELGLKVVPTFKIIKDSKVVKEVTGAKLDNLIAAIEMVKSS